MPTPKKSGRVSMAGMGADAFFSPLAPAEEEIELAPDSVEQAPGSTQKDSKPVHQVASLPLSQEVSKPVSQEASKPYIKASYYITPEQDMKLEEIRLKRRQHGNRVDKSALVREAIELLNEE